MSGRRLVVPGFEDGLAGVPGDRAHVARAFVPAEGHDQLGLLLAEHLAVPDTAGVVAVALPVGRAGLRANAAGLGPVPCEPVGAGGQHLTPPLNDAVLHFARDGELTVSGLESTSCPGR